jgi:hypothetical protein
MTPEFFGFNILRVLHGVKSLPQPTSATPSSSVVPIVAGTSFSADRAECAAT